MYDRWECVDRDFGDAQGLRVCNQDGTKHAVYWGNNTTSPGGAFCQVVISEGAKDRYEGRPTRFKIDEIDRRLD